MGIPLIIAEKAGNTVKTAQGYGFLYKGLPVFLQKDGQNYTFNIYGLSAGSVQRGVKITRYRDAPQQTEDLDRLVDALTRSVGKNTTMLDTVRERFDFINHNPGVTTKALNKHMEEWMEKRRRK